MIISVLQFGLIIGFENIRIATDSLKNIGWDFTDVVILGFN